jgi:hypothetical protein
MNELSTHHMMMAKERGHVWVKDVQFYSARAQADPVSRGHTHLAMGQARRRTRSHARGGVAV